MEQEVQSNNSDQRDFGIVGIFWYAGWLFTIAFVELVWWKAILGIVIWPYYLGTAL